MKVVLIRHLPTPWNILGQLQGKKDIAIKPICDQSRAVIDQQKQHLMDKYGNLPQAFVSELMRTQQTANAYGVKEPIIEPLLNELDFGEFEGRAKSELIAHYQPEWFDNPESIVLGEPITALADRVRAFFHKYADLKQLLIFGHGNWIRAAMSLAAHQNLSIINQIQLGNNEVVELSWN